MPAEDALKAEIKGLGLDAKGLDIKIDGDKVKVSGTAVSQEMKEKRLHHWQMNWAHHRIWHQLKQSLNQNWLIFLK